MRVSPGFHPDSPRLHPSLRRVHPRPRAELRPQGASVAVPLSRELDCSGADLPQNLPIRIRRGWQARGLLLGKGNVVHSGPRRVQPGLGLGAVSVVPVRVLTVSAAAAHQPMPAAECPPQWSPTQPMPAAECPPRVVSTAPEDHAPGPGCAPGARLSPLPRSTCLSMSLATARPADAAGVQAGSSLPLSLSHSHV